MRYNFLNRWQERVVPQDAGNKSTNPSIFLRLRASDAEPRQIAWDEFNARYAPIIGAFARRMGARPQDVDDIIQDVLLGFFLKSPTFIYDPAKGRFRSYLKVCTYRAMAKRFAGAQRSDGKSLEMVNPDEMAVDQIWNDVWEQALLRRALDDVRTTTGHTKTFRAFELYVVFDQPAQDVAAKLDMHINSVYRAKEQVSRLLQEKVLVLQQED
jgi:RNA polymerase sigma factor (sigma-70 family)